MRIKRACGVLALAGVLVLAGCGDDGGNNDQTAGDDTTESASSEPSEEATESTEVDLDEFLADLRDGAEALTTAHMTMTIRASGQTIEGEADIDYGAGEPEMAMTMSMGAQGTVEMRLVDGSMYMKIPGQGGDTWLKMSMADAMGQLGLGEMLDNLDPAKAFEAYADGFTGATLVGEEDVDGVSTTHYKVTLDTSKIDALENLPNADQIPDTMDYDIWLDDENRMRKVVIDLPGSMSMEMLVSDYGEPVEIEAPPASEVQDMSGAG